ncbi:hypothetical protein OG413_41355 [Streptomyces sp. NBC_01433]|uniref:hypothetical protein n=1 Tax=Streptomyces sp. NBC_01433 TaxID=2903864 RepID=UPI00225BBC50|nr:hypothetical protein [Streptomyces sp. NBC_01433]MCX4681651.1 hypothetical protein [Streptomyces sp. NBC_01433]
MPENNLKYDPTTTEGEAIASLFRGCKNIEDSDGSWNGGDIVEWLSNWFADLGIDPDGPSYQVDAIQPQVCSPGADPDTIAEILSALPDFTLQSLPVGDEGFFYANYDEPSFYDDPIGEDSATTVVFPYASDVRVRAALAVLRRAGYIAAPSDVDPRGWTIHVQASVVYALQDNATTSDRADRLLQEAGFSRADTPREAYIPSYTAPAPVPWRPDWVQIDVISLPTTGRDDREETARAVFATLTDAGWSVDVRGTETLHTTPPPAEPTPKPAAEPQLVPADVIDSIRHVLAYNWTTEQRDYDQQDPEDKAQHIATHLNRIATHLDPAAAHRNLYGISD